MANQTWLAHRSLSHSMTPEGDHGVFWPVIAWMIACFYEVFYTSQADFSCSCNSEFPVRQMAVQVKRVYLRPFPSLPRCYHGPVPLVVTRPTDAKLPSHGGPWQP